jgi:hypothetical protein
VGQVPRATGADTMAWGFLEFADVIELPTTLAGYGIADAYTKTQTDNLLAGKSNVGHTHDDRYYTDAEVDDLLAGKSAIGHTHAGAYEPVLGNPAGDGYVLTSTALGVRSWQASGTPSAHELVGAVHTVSGLTPGHFLKALTDATFGFAAHGLSYGDVGADAAGAAAAVTPTTLGLVIGTNTQAYSLKLTAIAALASAAGWLHNDGAGAFAYSTPTYGDVGALAVGGTAADSAKLNGQSASYYAVAGAAPAAHVLDGALHTVSGLTTGHFLKATGATTFAFAAHGLSYGDVGADPAGAAAAVSPITLGLVIGTNVQAYSAKLGTFAALVDGAGWLHSDGAGTYSWSTPSKADVGLSAVENTALSTWAGTVNITTLGTVVTGVWHGTAVADAYVASAAAWNAKVDRAGDTMTGQLLLQKSTAPGSNSGSLTLDELTVNTGAAVAFLRRSDSAIRNLVGALNTGSAGQFDLVLGQDSGMWRRIVFGTNNDGVGSYIASGALTLAAGLTAAGDVASVYANSGGTALMQIRNSSATAGSASQLRSLNTAASGGYAITVTQADAAEVDIYALGSTLGGTLWAGLTGNSQSVIEAAGATSFVISTGNAASIVLAINRNAVLTLSTTMITGVLPLSLGTNALTCGEITATTVALGRASGGNILGASGSGTNAMYGVWSNTTGHLAWGINNSAGTVYGSGTAYESFFGSNSATQTTIISNSVQRLTISSAGAFDFKGNTVSMGALTATTGVFTDATDASSSTTGALKTAGGLGVAKKLYVGSDLDVTSFTTLRRQTVISTTDTPQLYIIYAANYFFALTVTATNLVEFDTGNQAGSGYSFVNGGVLVGGATGGQKGTGTINLAGDIYKNNTAYNSPDYVLELWATGGIKRYADRPGARGYALLPLALVEAHARDYWRLPGVPEGPLGMFARGDIALEKIEELFIHTFSHEHRIAALEAELLTLKAMRN